MMLIKLKNKGEKQRGFTLIELIVVMAILAILAAMAIPKFTGVTSKAKQDANNSNVNLIAHAAELYYDSHKQTMPENIEALVNDGYLKENPTQPVAGSGTYTATPSATDPKIITIAPGKCVAGVPAVSEDFIF